MTNGLLFKVVLIEEDDEEVLGAANGLPLAYTLYEEALSIYTRDRVELRQGARVIAKSKYHAQEVAKPN